MKFPSFPIGRFAVQWAVFGFSAAVTVIIVSIVYATVSWGSLPTVNSGSGLTATAWNDLVSHVNQSVKQASPVITVSGSNVGIGITTPATNLEVHSATAAALRISGANGNSQQLQFGSVTAPTQAYLYSYYNGGSPYFSIYNNAVEAVHIDNLGNVGIGTTSPVAKLDIQGTMKQGNLTTYVRTPSFSQLPNTITYPILRQFHDSANWSEGGILVEVFTFNYNASIFDYGMSFARYGYGANSADVLTKIAGSQTPTWGAVTQISGNYYYRDLSITVPAYYIVTVRITSPIPITSDLTSPQANVVYLY
ncbi:MAG: hypothetical protein ACD_78C00306G0002 [uncultured bacterium (gcode 4)]|uniref:Uncharacterized protein n=1 Tax=uncultured bacterium (gcode 4) TaxID=1234023 RepID=K1XXQ7_9BACT|nr:MAG: hypothetical protein ACD_78C00306G0002 [uncultured bacterium (gcode 4)]